MKDLWKDGALMHIVEEYSQVTKLEIMDIFEEMFETKLPIWELTQRLERLRDRNLISVAYVGRESGMAKVWKPKKSGQERPEVAMNRDVVADIEDIKILFEAWAKKAGLDKMSVRRDAPKKKIVKKKIVKRSHHKKSH